MAMESYQEELYDDDRAYDEQWEEAPLQALQWDDDFYNKVDDSIFKAVEQAMGPLEDRLARRIDQASERMARVAPAPSADPTCGGSSADLQPPPAKRLGLMWMPFPVSNRRSWQ